MLKAISTITNALGALNYKGTWNASTNNPTLADGTGAKGDYYVTSTAGTQTFGGLQLFFGIGDWIVYNGAVWQRVEGGSDGNFANVTMTSTDAGAAAAPLLDLYRDSATPAASDTLGEIEFNGEDSAGNKQQYAVIHASILSATSGAEQGQLHFETATAGASTEKMIIGTINLVINEIGAIYNVRIEGDTDANLFFTDATNDRIGVGTITPSVKLDVNGLFKISTTMGVGAATPAASGAGVTFPATQSSSSDVNTFDDYEEGTFTPTITMGTSGTATIDSTANTWSYTKVGRLVTITGWASISSVSSPIGEMIINNLPFSSAAGTEFSARAAGSVVLQDSGAGMVGVAVLTINASSSTLSIRKTTAGVVAGFAAGDIITSTNFYVGITYIAAT
jgi:hypothetical protein